MILSIPLAVLHGSWPQGPRSSRNDLNPLGDSYEQFVYFMCRSHFQSLGGADLQPQSLIQVLVRHSGRCQFDKSVYGSRAR